MLKEFKPALLFLGKFLLVYFLGNLIYGFYVESFGEKPDPVTSLISHQTSWILNKTGYNTRTEDHSSSPKVIIEENGLGVLNVFEGCNGVNVMIVFIAFLIAYGGRIVSLIVFLISGVILIHLFNLLRVCYLFYLAYNNSQTFYFYHKYFFTATLYAVVFGLWAIWVIWFNEKNNRAAAA
jgi:exosortase family protein XrtF